MITLAMLKVLSGHDGSLDVPPFFYHALTLLEFLLGVGLLHPTWRRFAATGVLSLMAVAAVVALSMPKMRCGCFGSRIVATQGAHMTIASLLGIAAMACLFSVRSRRGPMGSGPAAQVLRSAPGTSAGQIPGRAGSSP